MARLAARELQTYVQKISGATLPIVTTESGGGRNPIYVGKSAATEKRKVGGDDVLTGEKWEMDLNLRQTFKMENKELGVGEQDELGSLNAVPEFLRGLGVRWYLPGDTGEIVPKQASIALPKSDRTVMPDFSLRYPYQYGKRFAGKTEETLWQLRLGLNQAPDLIGPGYVAHGTNNMHARE